VEKISRVGVKVSGVWRGVRATSPKPQSSRLKAKFHGATSSGIRDVVSKSKSARRW